MEGTKGKVKAENRRVYLFIAVGLIAAVAIGYGVWRAGTPSTPSASDIATVTTEVATISESAGRIQTTTPAEDATVSLAPDPQLISPTAPDDPYLAPHAVVQAAPTNIDPTVVYRPENVMSAEASTEASTESAEPAQPATTREEAPADAGTPAPDGTTATDNPAAPATLSVESPAPTSPADQAESTEPLQTAGPAQATEPAEAGTATAATTTVEPAAPATTADNAPDAGADQPAGQAEPQEQQEAVAPAPDPEVEQAAVPQQKAGWWPFGNWFTSGS